MWRQAKAQKVLRGCTHMFRKVRQTQAFHSHTRLVLREEGATVAMVLGLIHEVSLLLLITHSGSQGLWVTAKRVWCCQGLYSWSLIAALNNTATHEGFILSDTWVTTYVLLKIAKRLSVYRPWHRCSFSALAHEGYEFQRVNIVGGFRSLNGA